jgi:hypothetical protein
MQDLEKERQLAEILELKAMWQYFLEYFKLGITGKSTSQENETKFLEVKSKIAMLHDTFMETLTRERQVGQGMMALVGRAITLRHVARMTDSDIKKINIEWHEAYLLINEKVNDLEEEIKRLADINPNVYKFNKLKNKTIANVNNFVKSSYFIFFAIVGGVVGAIYAFAILGGADAMYNNEATRPVYYFFEDGYREFWNEDQPLDSIKRVWSKLRGLPEKFEKKSGAGLMTRSTAERTFKRPVASGPTFAGADKLKDAKEYQATEITYSGSPGAGTAEIYMWRFESTYDAKQYMDELRVYRRDKLNQQQTGSLDGRVRIARFVNTIIYMTKGSTIMRDRLMDEETFRYAEKL